MPIPVYQRRQAAPTHSCPENSQVRFENTTPIPSTNSYSYSHSSSRLPYVQHSTAHLKTNPIHPTLQKPHPPLPRRALKFLESDLPAAFPLGIPTVHALQPSQRNGSQVRIRTSTLVRGGENRLVKCAILLWSARVEGGMLA